MKLIVVYPFGRSTSKSNYLKLFVNLLHEVVGGMFYVSLFEDLDGPACVRSYVAPFVPSFGCFSKCYT